VYDRRALFNVQIDQAHGDLYGIADDLNFIKAQLARAAGRPAYRRVNDCHAETLRAAEVTAVRPTALDEDRHGCQLHQAPAAQVAAAA
jgi:hypothetical protein